MPRSGYTLPVFAVAAAKAALLRLLQPELLSPQVDVNLLPQMASISIEQVESLNPHNALAITYSDPGDNLDLTRNTPIWAWVQLQLRGETPLVIHAGEGLGRHETTGEPAIYHYAQTLLEANLLPLIPDTHTAHVTIVLPEGRELAQRTSNEAFGIVEGLALLGTSGVSRPFSTESHLDTLRADLKTILHYSPHVVFCVGSHGLQVAEAMGLPEFAIAQTSNWVGALLVEAALQGAKSVLLLGYQGKLIKLAGGIFNTSSHLADAKLEIISAAIARLGGDIATIQAVLHSRTADAAYQYLRSQDQATAVFSLLAETISHKAQAYVNKYANRSLSIGTFLFDRKGRFVAQDPIATELLPILQGLGQDPS